MTTTVIRPGRTAPRLPADRVRTRGTSLRGGWRWVRPRLLVLLPILFLGAALGCTSGAWRIARDNATIRSLAAGQDVAVPVGSSPSLLLARVQHLARRGVVEAIEPLIAALDAQGMHHQAARARFALANAHLRQAFDHLERGDLDPAGPRITLARQEYRRALQGRPDYWDAKFNLDVASRLLRDFPEFDRKSGDALAAEPKKIWTDLPGQPRGEP